MVRLASMFILTSASTTFAALRVTHEPANNALPLVAGETIADVYVDANDQALPRKAASLFADDVQAVTGHRPNIVNDPAKLGKSAILIGSLHHSALIDQLIADHKIDTVGIEGQWDTYRILSIEHPLPQIDRAIVVIGSDRRGAAYGTFDISEAIGVSPWYWWADVLPQHQDMLYLSADASIQGPPSVKYRGIFINDEDWGLRPWAAKTFDPKFGNIGPKTYDKVFELMTRLKLNYLWPAMHPGTTEFGTIPENVTLADAWGIVMGASHTEVMNRNNVDWPTLNRGPWRFDTNKDAMVDYWKEWARQRGKYEAVWTVGLRGVHDSAMLGPPDANAKIKILHDAIMAQRSLLAQYVNPDATAVPQAFAPYKEVLDLYRAGLEVPDDISLVWCDDNYGYIRQLSNPKEQQRSGGSGVYYHISYLGRPFSYVWLNTTPPALIWEEMTKAYACGAQRIWVLNVGDIKPGEIGIDFWAHLAWNVHAYDAGTIGNYLKDFAARTFREKYAPDFAAVLGKYYQLSFERKPESLTTKVFSQLNYGEEGEHANTYRGWSELAESLAPTESQLHDAYYQLVVYPFKCASLNNELFEYAGKDDKFSVMMAHQFLNDIESATAYYNDELLRGKWKHIIMPRGSDSKTWAYHWPAAATQPTTMNASYTLHDDDAFFHAAIELHDPTTRPVLSFREIDGVVSIIAGHFQRNQAGAQTHWLAIPGLGRTADAVCVDPVNVPSVEDMDTLAKTAPGLDYDFTTTSSGNATIVTNCLPTYPLNTQRKLRFAVSLDSNKPQIIDLTDASAGKAWDQNVTTNTVQRSVKTTVAAPGQHTLHVYMVDPGVVLDKIVVDLGGMKPSALGPPETGE